MNQRPGLVQNLVRAAHRTHGDFWSVVRDHGALRAARHPTMTSNPWDVVRIAFPLLAYLAPCSSVASAAAFLGRGYEKTTTLAFTAAGNKFELAIEVAIGSFGVTSGQAPLESSDHSSKSRSSRDSST